ncbi:hypothetical protein AY599_04315 [Leptolyngbya valderiana BDU 20041]|nr:hypothetical protein AY599_04315 [Leptolyngbya valderiana BDU 20041]
MPTHAQLAAKLLRDAAGFFNTVGEQNPTLKDQMSENANVFQQMANLVETDPNGELQQPDGAPGAAPGDEPPAGANG